MRYPAIWKTGLEVDSDQLLAEFDRVLRNELVTIYPKNSDWTGITVFRQGGVNYLSDLPMLSSLASRVGFDDISAITYFNLSAKAKLHRHRDMNGNLLFGVLRLHIPLRTHPQAIMEVQKTPYHLPKDTVWVLDTSGLHALWNNSDVDRIHLVMDVKRSPNTERFFPKASVVLYAHLAQFLAIVSWKVIRDSIARPRSILQRVGGIIGGKKPARK